MRYRKSMVLHHWVVGVLYLCVLCFGLYITCLPDGYPGVGDLYNIHKFLGCAAFLLLISRCIVRVSGPVPPSYEKLSRLESSLSIVVHACLYFCMFAMPISGFMMTLFYGGDINFYFFKLSEVTSSVHVDKDIGYAFKSIHLLTWKYLLGFVCLHVLATVKHCWDHGFGFLKRML